MYTICDTRVCLAVSRVPQKWSCLTCSRNCRLNASAGDVVTVQFRSMLFPGQSVIIRTEYTGSLLSGLARTAAFEYTNPDTRRPDTQVT